MIYEGGNVFTINYGRIESTKTTLTKSISQWNSVYNEKIKKGYKDVTDLVSVQVEEKKENTKGITDYEQIKNKSVNNFIEKMRQYTDGLVKKTYSVKCDKVSKKQLDEAQRILNEITKLDKKKEKEINDKLLELYSVIPRYMSNTRTMFLPHINLDKTITQEQDNIDALSSQVSIYNESETKEITEKTVKEVKQTFLDVLGINIDEIDYKKDKNIDYIIKQLTSRNIKHVFSVNKQHENNIFDKWIEKQDNTSTRYLIHGTRCTSVIPILKEGLKIRPTGNFQFSGKVYGNGNYFSEVTSKSLNYTGYDSDKILLVYEVHTGNPFVYNGWYNGNSFPLNYKELKKRGYDSTHVNAGNGLLNSEIIAYDEQQCRIKYIIWL